MSAKAFSFDITHSKLRIIQPLILIQAFRVLEQVSEHGTRIKYIFFNSLNEAIQEP